MNGRNLSHKCIHPIAHTHKTHICYSNKYMFTTSCCCCCFFYSFTFSFLFFSYFLCSVRCHFFLPFAQHAKPCTHSDSCFFPLHSTCNTLIAALERHTLMIMCGFRFERIERNIRIKIHSKTSFRFPLNFL